MYNNIYDPINNSKHSITSAEGLQLLKNYLQEGGRRVGTGTYKCVFSPALKCGTKRDRFTLPGKNPDEFVGALMDSNKEIRQEIKEDKILKHIDPKRKFTLPILKQCSAIKPEDSPGLEQDSEFDECPFPIYEWDNSVNPKIKQLIYKKGGEDLSNVLKNLKARLIKVFSDTSKSKAERNKNTVQVLVNIVDKFTNILEGLSDINKQQFTHRDIKPTNILYDYDKYYIIDFGFMSKFQDCLTNESSDNIYKEYTINYGHGAYYYRYWPIDIGITYKLLYPHTDFDFAVDSLSDPVYKLQHPYNSNRTQENIVNLFNKYNGASNEDDFCRDSITKFDVFSISMAMKEYFPKIFTDMIDYVESLGIKNQTLKKLRKDIYPKINSLIMEGLTFDPMDRLTIQEFTKKYIKIVKSLNSKQVKSPALSITMSSTTPKPTGKTKGCKSFKKNKDPKCNDQSHCIWKKGVGCMEKPKKIIVKSIQKSSTKK